LTCVDLLWFSWIVGSLGVREAARTSTSMQI
jgi:hypothetical protein